MRSPREGEFRAPAPGAPARGVGPCDRAAADRAPGVSASPDRPIGARARGLRDDERGSVTAEFAIVLPAVLAVLGVVIGGVFIASHRLVLVDAAAELSRLEARGDERLAAERLARLPGGVAVERSREGPLHCVALSSRPGGGLLSAVTVNARACAVALEEVP